MKGIIIHVEKFTFNMSEEDLQRILFAHFKIKTGNPSKMEITGAGFPMKVEWQELLKEDFRRN